MDIFSIGTFNVRGLTVDQKKQNLAIDVKNYKLDLCCIQETKIKVGSDINIGECRLITFSADVQHYGTGFIVAKKWANNISKYWKVSERISVIQIKIKDEYKCRKVSDTKVVIYRSVRYKIV